jgi:hypothetical protein
MIRVSYVPQVGVLGRNLSYAWSGRSLRVRLEPDGREEICDLSTLRPGDEVVGVEPEALPFSPLISARCLEDGTLKVVLLHWYEGVEPPELGEEVLDG